MYHGSKNCYFSAFFSLLWTHILKSGTIVKNERLGEKMGEKKRIQISISTEKLAELENFCRENGMSKSGALQYAWTEFLKLKNKWEG